MSHTLIGHSAGPEYRLAHRCEPNDTGPTRRVDTLGQAYDPGDIVRCDDCGQLWFCSGCSDSGYTLYWRHATWWDRRIARKEARRARREANARVRDLA